MPCPPMSLLALTGWPVLQVALVPGEAFGSPSTVRISYAASMDTITKAMDRLEEALQPGKFTRA